MLILLLLLYFSTIKSSSTQSNSFQLQYSTIPPTTILYANGEHRFQIKCTAKQKFYAIMVLWRSSDAGNVRDMVLMKSDRNILTSPSNGSLNFPEYLPRIFEEDKQVIVITMSSGRQANMFHDDKDLPVTIELLSKPVSKEMSGKYWCRYALKEEEYTLNEGEDTKKVDVVVEAIPTTVVSAIVTDKPWKPPHRFKDPVVMYILPVVVTLVLIGCFAACYCFCRFKMNKDQLFSDYDLSTRSLHQDISIAQSLAPLESKYTDYSKLPTYYALGLDNFVNTKSYESHDNDYLTRTNDYYNW